MSAATTPNAVWPAALVLLATTIDALFPLAVVMTLTDHDPLVFGAGVVAGLAAGSVIYLAATSGELLHAVVANPLLLARFVARRSFVLAALGRLDRPLFVAAVALGGATVPTLIHGITPIGYMLVLQASMGAARYRPMGLRAAPWLGLAAAGVSLVVLSQPADSADGSWPLAAAVALSLVSAAAASLTAMHLLWGVEYAAAVAPADSRAETPASMLGTVLASLVAVPCLLIAGTATGSPAGVAGAFVAGAVIGVVLRTPYVLMLRIANYATKTVTVNALTYLAPVLALILLVMFDHAPDVRIPVAAAGAVAIIAANVYLTRQRA